MRQTMNKTLPSLLLILMVFTLAGCGYPKVSPKAYELSQALYTICNQRSGERLPLVSDLIEQSLEEGTLTAREGRWLSDIVATGEAGDWEEAAQEARRIMADQVE